MSSIVILGAGGFLGRTLIANGCFPMPVKAVDLIIPPDADLTKKNILWLGADLLTSKSLNEVLQPGDIVINLAYISGALEAKNILLIDNVIDACIHLRVDRLVHCSTAVVAGATPISRVNESTLCLPVTSYEKTKWALENRALSAISRGLDVGILRPTAIVGPGGQNLLSLARSLRDGSRIVNYFRAGLFGRRPMHLVPVRDVAAALLYLAVLPGTLNGEVFIISSDDDPENNFQGVEKILLKALGMAPRKLPLLPFPIRLLSLSLRLWGRSETNMGRIYDSYKIRSIGFKQVDMVAKAVCEFGEEFIKNQ
jgi:nucleoside-diphosphate-sugar epimerase